MATDVDNRKTRGGYEAADQITSSLVAAQSRVYTLGMIAHAMYKRLRHLCPSDKVVQEYEKLYGIEGGQ